VEMGMKFITVSFSNRYLVPQNVCLV